MIPQLVDFHVQLSATPRGARLGRMLAIEQLRAWGLPFEAPGQIIAELSANAITHGRVPGRDFKLALTVTPGTLLIEVTDTRSDRIPKIRDTGRGLLLVEALADRWGVREGPAPWKAVWAELSLTRGLLRRSDNPLGERASAAKNAE
ncbi:ATP-binding protein [Streptomyces sp. NPDC056492]|uniref:ATP-binding protein n=1 Tax=unclassified Streptomyces TaxID=2593676 RepID=UPI0036B8DC87